MGARELLDALGDAGRSVAAEGDQLLIRPGSKLTDEWRAALLTTPTYSDEISDFETPSSSSDRLSLLMH